MKMKKKTTLLVGFVLGALLMTTTAVADIANKSGYEQLKDGIKATAENCAEKFNNYTLDVSYALKDNGKVLSSSNEITKYDRLAGSRESQSNRHNTDGKDYNSYYYSDRTTDIRFSEQDNTYYVTEYAEARELNHFTNHFKEEEAGDIEKIADALVGNLKDHVVVQENPDGSKQLSGSLSEVQIPSLFNAFVSLQMKQNFNGRQDGTPHLTEDIFIKEVTGSAYVNPEGILENLLATAILSGKDDQGQVHELSLEMLFKLADVNSTSVAKPELAGQTVVKQEGKNYPSQPGLTNPQKYIGTYKNNILIEKDGRFVKIGERFLDVTHLDNSGIAGKYYEQYKEGYEEYAAKQHAFTFEAKFDKDPRSTEFKYVNEAGNTMTGHIYIDEFTAKVHLYLNTPFAELGYDSIFSPALD